MSKTIVMTGGGTAGHVMPNLAVIPVLKEQGYQIEYIGTKNGMEKDIIAKTDLPYHAISAGKLRRYFSLKNFTDPFRIMVGYRQARRLLKKLRPQAVFSKGGFVTVPVVFAAKKLGIPVVLHESDYTPGLANRLSIPKAKKICVSFPETMKHIEENKGVYTGLPIRESLLRGNRNRGLSLCGFSGDKPVLLIMGGSLGARALNETIDEIIPHLIKKYDVIHIRGKKNMLDGTQPKGYKQFGFIGEELGDIYAASDLMLSRAGATAVFEILALHLPALLIPLPKEQSRGDQILNAGHFEKNGWSVVMAQDDMGAITLQKQIDAVYSERHTMRKKMKEAHAENAAAKVADVILGAIEL